MSLPYFPVAYYEETGIWDHFFPHIKSRLPIHGVTVNLPEGDIMSPPITVNFLSHADCFWSESTEYTYKRPYLWLFILEFTNFEIFKRDIKAKLKERINTMEAKNIEWLVLFVPPFTGLVKSDHKHFLASYSKVLTEIKNLFGKANLTRFYCSSNKTFVDLGQPSCIKDEYWLDFVKSVGKGVAVSIQTAICTHLKASCIEMDKSFFLYSLNLHAIGLLYEKIGVKAQTSSYLEMIRENIALANIPDYREEDLIKNLETNGEKFCEGLEKKEISKVFSLRYLTDTIFNYLVHEKQVERASKAASSSISLLWGLYQRCKSTDLLFFLSDYSDTYIKNIQDKIQGNRYEEISKENRAELLYNLGCIFNIKLCAMVSGDLQHPPTSQPRLSEYLSLTRRISECFFFAGYQCKALLFKHIAINYVFLLEHFDVLNDIINQHSFWPSIDSINKKILLTHQTSLSSADRIKYISEMCINQWFPDQELEELWGKVYDLSLHASAFYLFNTFKTHTLKFFTVTQGQFYEVKFIVISPLKHSLKFHKLIARYSKNFGFNELSIENVELNPGNNTLMLSGVAWDCGSYKLEHLTGFINKFSCSFPVLSASVEVSPCCKVFRPTVYSILAPENRSFVVIELKTFNVDSQDIDLILNYPEGLFVNEEIESISFTNSGKNFEKKKIFNKKIKLINLLINGFLYFIFEFSSETYSSATVSFGINSLSFETSIEIVLRFAGDLEVSCSKIRNFLSVSMLNKNDFQLSVNSVAISPYLQSAGESQLPLTLDTNQFYYTFFEDPPDTSLLISYQQVLPPFKSFFESYFESSRSLEIKKAVNIT